MYVTRPLSHYIKYPDALSTPPEGPNSGYLVLQDEESETYCCFGLCKNRSLLNLPFPQNKNLTTGTPISSEPADVFLLLCDTAISLLGGTTGTPQQPANSHVSYNDVVFIPVLNQPLSSNRYYAIQPHGSHKGSDFYLAMATPIALKWEYELMIEACQISTKCSKEEDKATCCFCRCIKDIKPRPLNPQDLYQQFQISIYETACRSNGSFYAKSLAPDGFPPEFLRRKGWEILTKTPKNYKLDEALGINNAIRARLPDFNFPLSNKNSEPVIVGKWYCPFMFVKEGTLRDQMKQSMFYQMTLEQKWEQIFSCENEHNQGNVLSVDVAVQREVVFVDRREAVWDARNVVDGAIWYTSSDDTGKEIMVGLSLEIVQRMKWEEERVGWIGGEDRQVMVKKEDKFGGVGGWKRFGCYVLVERFELKRMNGSLLMAYDFKHTHQIKTKWE